MRIMPADLLAEVVVLRTLLRESHALLRELEWSETVGIYGERACPTCSAMRASESHFASCELVALLRRLEALERG